MLVTSASVIPGYRLVKSEPPQAAPPAVAQPSPADGKAASDGSARGQPVFAGGRSQSEALAGLAAAARVAGANAVLDVTCRSVSPAEAVQTYLASGEAVTVEPV